MQKPKILIIRFSSIGDVTQTLSVASRLGSLGGEVHWAVRTDLGELLKGHPNVNQIWRLERREGFRGLVKLIRNLWGQKFTHVYDAHGSLRSKLVMSVLALQFPKMICKSQKRWKRFLLFQLRRNTYQMPFSGQRDLLEPLAAWGLSTELPAVPQIFPSPSDRQVVASELAKVGLTDFIALCPSAAYELKRWPVEHWKRLIELLPTHRFVLLGGLHDRFVGDLVLMDPNRIFNFAGRLSLMESAALLDQAKVTISNDTGLLHIAEQLGKKTIALMGPAPFGFPSRPSTRIMELDLSCRPCSKHGQGPCINPKFHQCLVDIKPEHVIKTLESMGEK